MKADYKAIVVAAIKAIAATLIINALLFVLFDAIGWIPKEVIVPQAQGPITLVPVLMASLIPSLLGTLLYMLLASFTPKANLIFTVISALVLLVSFYNPFTIPGVPAKMIIALNILHIPPAVSIVYFLTRHNRSIK